MIDRTEWNEKQHQELMDSFRSFRLLFSLMKMRSVVASAAANHLASSGPVVCASGEPSASAARSRTQLSHQLVLVID